MRKFSFLWVLSALMPCVPCAYGNDGQAYTRDGSLVMSLQEMFSVADSLNSTIKVSRIAAEEARVGEKVARNAWLPSVDASLSLGYNGNGYIMDRDFSNGFTAEIPSFGNNFRLEVSQVIFSGGAIRSSVGIAGINTELAVLDVEKNRDEVHFLIAGDYIELCKLANQARVIDNNIKLAENVAESIKARVDNGTALKTDVTRIELLIQNLKYTRIQISGAQQIVCRELANALGMDQETVIVPAGSVEAAPLSDRGFWEEEAMNCSPALKSAEAAVRLSLYKEKAAKSERLPKIAFFAGEYLDGPVVIDIPAVNKNFNYWAVGIGIKYNLASLYKSPKDISRSRLETARSREQLNVAREQVSLAINAAYTDFHDSFLLLDTKVKSVELARESYELVSFRYSEGLALITDLLDASHQLLDAQLQEVNARMNISYNYYRLQYISGTI